MDEVGFVVGITSAGGKHQRRQSILFILMRDKMNRNRYFVEKILTMDIQAIKIDLIHWLTEVQDPEVLRQLTAIKSGQDWWDEISEDERLEILEGLSHADRGEVVSHESAMEKYKKWL